MIQHFCCCFSWLFEGVGRQKAEELLCLPGNRQGSFLVRESNRERGEYVFLHSSQQSDLVVWLDCFFTVKRLQKHMLVNKKAFVEIR